MNELTSSLYMTEVQRQAKRKSEERKKQERDDLAEVLALPAGRRFLQGLLLDLGLARWVSAQEEIYTRNLALKIFGDMREADPRHALEVLAQIHNLGE